MPRKNLFFTANTVPKNILKIILRRKCMSYNDLERRKKLILQKSKLDLLIDFVFCGSIGREKEVLTKDKKMKFVTLNKDFTVNGIVIPKGTKFRLIPGNNYHDGVGFDKNGTFSKPHHFGWQKNLNIPREYFNGKVVEKYLSETFGL